MVITSVPDFFLIWGILQVDFAEFCAVMRATGGSKFASVAHREAQAQRQQHLKERNLKAAQASTRRTPLFKILDACGLEVFYNDVKVTRQ